MRKSSILFAFISLIVILFALISLIAVFALLAPGFSTAAKTVDNDTEAVVTTAENESPESTPLTVDAILTAGDYEYVEYGRLLSANTLIGNADVVVAVIEPIQKGGEYFEAIGLKTVLIPINEVIVNNSADTAKIVENDATSWLDSGDNYYFKFTLKNCEDSGGYISLPDFVIEIEEIQLEDIPSWGGA